jgi:predicted PurR-regulated permease PerM
MNNEKKIEVGVICFIFVGFIFILNVGLLPALIAGFITFLMMRYCEHAMSKYLSLGKYSNFFATVSISFIIIAILTLFSVYFFNWIGKTLNNPDVLINETALILDKTLKDLPANISGMLPHDIHNFKDEGLSFIQSNLIVLRDFSKGATHTLITMILGMIIGIMIASGDSTKNNKPLVVALKRRISNLVESFKHVMVAQAGIATFNSLMTSIFLLIVMPLFGVNFPFAKTIIFLTFFIGLIPIIGNIIVNAIVLIIGLSVSVSVGISALCYLILIHKFEYFLNAKIIGGRIEAKAFELLVAMLIMESIYGITGLIAAPILYAYIKKELKQYDLV